MKLSVHLFTSILLAAALYPFVGFYSLWVLVGGFLIDVDHYLWTLLKCKKWSLSFCYKYHDRRHVTKYEPDILHIFHTVEVWIGIVATAIICYIFNWTFFFWMITLTFISMALHIGLDFINLIKTGTVDARAISLVKWLKRRNYL